MASTAVRLGKDACLYRNTGSYASPTWDIIDNVRDLTLGLEMDGADASIRSYGGYAADEPTLLRVPVSFNMNYDTADTDWEALRAAFFGRTAVECLILDRATAAGAQGMRASFKLHKFGRGEPLAGIQTTDVEMKPCIAINAPAWYVGV